MFCVQFVPFFGSWSPEGRDDYSRAINGREVSRLRNPRGSADIDPATEEGKAEHKTFFRNLQLLDPDRAGISAKIEAGTSVKNQIVKFNRRKNLNSTDANPQLLEKSSSLSTDNGGGSGNSKIGSSIASPGEDFKGYQLKLEKDFSISTTNENQISNLEKVFSGIVKPNELLQKYTELRNQGEIESKTLDSLFLKSIINMAGSHKSFKDIKAVQSAVTIIANENLGNKELQNIFHDLVSSASISSGFLRAAIGIDSSQVEANLPQTTLKQLDILHEKLASPEYLAHEDKMFAILKDNPQYRMQILNLENDVLASFYKTIPILSKLIKTAQRIEKTELEGLTSGDISTSEMKSSKLNGKEFVSDVIHDPIYSAIKASESHFPDEFTAVKDRLIVTFDLRTSTQTTSINVKKVQTLSALLIETLGSKVFRFEGDGGTVVIPNTPEARVKLQEAQKLLGIAQAEFGMNMRLNVFDSDAIDVKGTSLK